MREKEQSSERPRGAEEETIEAFDRFLGETPEGKFLEGEPLSKYAVNEPALREKPEKVPEGAIQAEAEIEQEMDDDPGFRYFKTADLPKPEDLREPKLHEQVPPHEPADVFQKAEALLAGRAEAVFPLDEQAAERWHFKSSVFLRKSGEGYSVFVETEPLEDPDEGTIIEATKFKLFPDRAELVFAVGRPETGERIDEPVKVNDLTEERYAQIATILEHLVPL